ncbi:MAG TPA: hypothetical protein VGQ06_09895 [Gemmatimonadales bacterium]|jgi:hypothetical protein|nr:hypothetical protein [Gemmatimonadales bacterium]
MTAGAAPATSATDRSDFRHILVSGTKIGVAVGAGVIAYLLISRFVPAGAIRALLQALLVLGVGVVTSFLPAQWTGARSTQGIAGAAAVGLWGTIVFMAIDIILLRPLKAYPWTWDAVGGGSTWWYLPIWWMLGTFVAWMGGVITAGRATRGGNDATSLRSLALPVLAGAVAITAALQVARLGIYLPVAAGAGFTVTLTVLAVVAIARKA